MPSSVADELLAYFESRKSVGVTSGRAAEAARRQAAAQFRTPRFRALYRAWQQQGERVLWSARSSALKDKASRGEIRFECVELKRQYMHLSPLVGKS